MSDILNNYVDGPNSSNSLFTSGRDLSPQSNFHPTFDCIQINNNNGIHSLIEQSNFPLINEQDLSDNGPRDNTGGQYSNTVPVGRPYGKHSLFKKYDHYFSCELFDFFSFFKLINLFIYFIIYFIIYCNWMYCVFVYYLMLLYMFGYKII